jgi:DNA modification methylase
MTVIIRHGDCREVLRTMPDQSVHCCVTSPPYFGLRDYGTAKWDGGDPECDHSPDKRGGRFATPVSSKQASNTGSGSASSRDCPCGATRIDSQIGLEATPDAFVAEMVAVFREVRRVLRDDGTLWLNLGDSYNNRTKVRTTSHQPALNGFKDDNWAERAARGGVRMSQSDGDLKEKDLHGIPWMVAFALRADGWYLRQDIIWSKPNPMPESVQDRCTKAHEYLFMLSKSKVYHYDASAIAEPASDAAHGGSQPNPGPKARATGNHSGSLWLTPKQRSDKQRGHSRRHAGFNDRWDEMERAEQCSGTRNKRSVWEIAPQPFSEAHFATFPPALVEPCILAGCPAGGTVLDPFGGAGTTGMVADRLGRNAILIELNPEYAAMAQRRIEGDAGMFAQVSA